MAESISTPFLPDEERPWMGPTHTPKKDIQPPSLFARPPRLSRRSWRRQIYRDMVYRGISFLVRLIRFLGPKRSAALANRIGVLLFTLQRRERMVALTNLEDCLGDSTTLEEREEIAKRVFRNSALSVAESIGLSAWGKWENWVEFEMDGLENLNEALREGKGAVCVNAHFGNWEVMTALICASGYPGTVVTRPVKDPRLDEWVTRIRIAYGIQVIQRGKTPLRMIKTLRHGGMLGVMIDMDTRSSRGIFVDFFGKPAYTQTGPFVLARRTGSPIVPTLCYREGDNRLRFYFGQAWKVDQTENPEADIRAAAQRATKELEDRIRERPEQWAWFHKRWKTRPEKFHLKRRDE
ncbi:MAG: lysophospholipid acyltransferase family protein [Candidatus Omnitrophica bacterium]|nr:lysophospholipid acyltransferase family protein [Candidatus Omnitrophota bacterium]MCA9446933.1 lysophospholipid acyltransferase family protein [Candidatus Omnitrophota bacterium]MCB9782099.1 lysophospholipid acyltransferase family protein [Candidatus Omnitrophota bacterium]